MYLLSVSHIIQYLTLRVSHYQLLNSQCLSFYSDLHIVSKLYSNLPQCLTLYSTLVSVSHITQYLTLSVSHYTVPYTKCFTFTVTYILCLALCSIFHSLSHIIQYFTLRVSHGTVNYTQCLILYSI